ncbi:hypothetical protein [Psychroserpens mesophilus]|uniref:hypothetical protein n=1 Tax=Psychroserpens mesophilus TaxID=325473 RepID=UPI003D661038
MKRILITVCMLSLFFSCSNDDSQTNEELQEDNFYALRVGNSWVYKNYKYNVNMQTYEYTGVVDSVSIVSKETILGVDYFKFRRFTTGNEEGITFCNPNGEHFEYLREYDGNLIWDDGRVKFTNSNYTERILNTDPNLSLREILVEGETEMTVEAGTFTCINSERYMISNGEPTSGLDKFYYADGFGLIYDTSSFVSDEIPSIIRRLDSYNIQ